MKNFNFCFIIQIGRTNCRTANIFIEYQVVLAGRCRKYFDLIKKTVDLIPRVGDKKAPPS